MAADGPRLLIAVVDDEESVRKSLRRLLAAAELEAVTFASGQEFLDSLRLWRPDCLILDLQMPGLSGLEVQRQLADRQVLVPTIIMTADDDTGQAGSAQGAVAYLCKPFEEHVLLALITRAVKGAPPP
jgi:FixJ family two-component response regulator